MIMAVTRARKTEQVEKLGKDLQNVSTVIVTTYTKLTVPQDYELRKLLRSSGAKYAVVKNTLAERAAKGTKVEEALKDLSGVTSIAYTAGDPVALAKALSKYAKDNPEFTFKAGVVEGRVISIKEIESLATMPSKEEIYSKLLFLMNAPAQRLVTVMNAVGRDIAVVINQGVEKQKFGGEAISRRSLKIFSANFAFLGDLCGQKLLTAEFAETRRDRKERMNLAARIWLSGPRVARFWFHRVVWRGGKDEAHWKPGLRITKKRRSKLRLYRRLKNLKILEN